MTTLLLHSQNHFVVVIVLIGPPPSNVRLSNSVNGTNNSTVTIVWTPPPNAGNVMYAITVIPIPESGDLMDTSLTQTTITVLYNTHYTINVSVNTLCAEVAAFTFTLG